MNFQALFDRLYPELFRYCHRLTGDPDASDDAVQEAFVRMLEQELDAEPRAARVWLFRVATNLVRDGFRNRETRLRLLRANPPRPSAPGRPDGHVEREERIAVVRSILSELDPRARELLLMREEGFSYKEMAEATGVAVGSVGQLLNRAERKFVDEFRKQGYENDTLV